MSEQVGEWHECVVDSDYEINDAYPYPIRRKGSDKIIKESIHKSIGYVRCALNGITYNKHRIIAQQFIPNDDLTKTEIDHIDHNRANNHISNLRWCSPIENLKNKSSHKGVQYEYFDEIDDEAIEITDYGKHHFEFYYYVEAEDSFYFFNGVQYRRLYINYDKRNGNAFVQTVNTEKKNVKINVNKFKRLYGIDF